MKLSSFNDSGIAAFRQYIGNLRESRTDASLSSVMTAIAFVETMTVELPDVCPVFQTKGEMISWLKERFDTVGFQPDEKAVGLWTWLAAYMFESICPLVDGVRKAKADAHYILDVIDYRRIYRHLVVAPWRVYMAAPVHSRLFLNEKPWTHGELMEQGMSRLFLMRIPAVAEAMERLYFNPETGRAKKGIMSKIPKRGDFRNRFPSRIQQLKLTYDFMSMNADQLLTRLGAEFGCEAAQEASDNQHGE